jgi:HEAT repeat protein
MSALVAVDRKEAEPILVEWLLTGNGSKPFAAIYEFKEDFNDASSNVVHLFLKAIETRPDVRERIIVSLGEMGEQARDAVPKLLDVMHDSDPKVQAAAKTALLSINAVKDPK